MNQSPDLDRRAQHIKLLLMDCDGVLTDGRITLIEDGDEQKSFHVRDGQGIALLHSAGLKTGIISGRASQAVERRARELGIAFIRQKVEDKVSAFEEILAAAEVLPSECAYIGDDLGDIPLMLRVELAVAVADAVEEILHVAHHVTESNGGRGAVREVCELILKAQGNWTRLMKGFHQA